MGATSAHFSAAELACRHCGVNDCKQDLVDALEQFRAEAGKPVIIDDAYRCLVHNLEVHGASHSQHLEGIAADIRIPGMSAVELEQIAHRCPLVTAIGRSDLGNYIHIDTRVLESGARVAWCYGGDGQAVDYYSA